MATHKQPKTVTFKVDWYTTHIDDVCLDYLSDNHSRSMQSHGLQHTSACSMHVEAGPLAHADLKTDDSPLDVGCFLQLLLLKWLEFHS